MGESYPTIYTLTELTGRRSGTDRRVIIQGFDLPMRSVIIGGIVAVPAFIATVIVWQFVGGYSVLTFFVVEAAAFWLIEGTTSRQMGVKNYQALADRRRSSVGQFYMCGRRFDPHAVVAGTLRVNTVPVTHDSDIDRLDVALTGRTFTKAAQP